MSVELFVGLMSGTSLDGVDAVLVQFADRPHCLATHFVPYPDDLRAESLAIQAHGINELHRAATLSNRLADIYAQATNELLAKSDTKSSTVSAIACHGQTVRHVPIDGYTLQLNNPARLVELTGIATIADFRSRDIAAGGQGAPLVPAFHDAMFRHETRHRLILNIGGIANLTNLAPGNAVSGFDCGPGNMLLDAWASRHLGQSFDVGGQWATQGNALPSLLERLRSHPYFTMPPPKSCGREEFGVAWLDAQLLGNEAPVDVQATLVLLTAATIADAIRQRCGAPQDIFVCGGGAHNNALMDALAKELTTAAVQPTDVLGLPADWVEAMAFAWLGHRTLHGQPGSDPNVTGARGPRILGAIYPA